jgi:hypothetical protein
MACFCNHGVVAVTGTLPETTRMDMYVGDYGHAQGPAFVPDKSKLAAVELDDAIGEAVRIDVVIEQKLAEPANLAFEVSEEECSAFVRASSAPPQFVHAVVPQLRLTDQLRTPICCCTQQRSK